MPFSIEGQTIVLFGASSGMGLETAKAARAAGANVTIVARDPQRLDRARAEVGGTTRAEALDGADTTAVQALFDTFDRIDHVASFTGEQPQGSVADTSHDLFQRAMDARVWAARNVCAAAAPRMPPTGSLTFCSGVSSVRPRANRSAGAAATAALESFARAMAVELAPIRVNTICPGSFDTAVLDRAFGERKDEMMRRYLAQLPLGRLGRPEELAHAVLFLMTATYVTGTVLHVDGGALLI